MTERNGSRTSPEKLKPGVVSSDEISRQGVGVVTKDGVDDVIRGL